MKMHILCPLCRNKQHIDKLIKLYASSEENVFCCPICESTSNNDDHECVFNCLECGHILCNMCINNMLNIQYKNMINQNNNSYIDIDNDTYNRLLKISKSLVRVLRYHNHRFIVNHNNIISAPLHNLYDIMDKNIVSPPIEMTDIYQIAEYFKYRSGRKRFGITPINGIEYIDTDTRNHEY